MSEGGVFAVLNPGGRDPRKSFQEGPGKPGSPGHPPINFHAYAACMRGDFLQSSREVSGEHSAVLVLLRSDLRDSLRAVQLLKTTSRRVAIAWKECGIFQVAEKLRRHEVMARFFECCSLADCFVSPVRGAWSGCERHVELPTPYPIEFPAWNFDRPLHERKGIFVGTREFRTASRNHARAVFEAGQLAVRTGSLFTVINTEGRHGRRMIERLAGNARGLLRIVEGKLPYPDYLRLMASHRIVFQRDASGVPGQVAGDALLCRMPCLGGNTAIELCLRAPESEAVLVRTEALLTDDAAWLETVRSAQARAAESCGFDAARRVLERSWPPDCKANYVTKL